MASHLELAQRYMTESIGLLQRSGYRLSLNFDLSGWAALLRSAPKIGIVNPTFDPAHSDLRANEAFWLQLNDEVGVAACIADRLFRTDDFVANELATGRVWYASPGEGARPELLPDVPLGRYTGRVGHAGGLWVHPRRRKDGLSWILPRLVRALSIINWSVDRHCGLVFEGIHDSGLSAQAYGFPELHAVVEGYFPPTRADARVFVIHIDLDQIVAQFEDDLVRMTDRHCEMRDVATIVGQRVHQPMVGAGVVQMGGGDARQNSGA